MLTNLLDLGVKDSSRKGFAFQTLAWPVTAYRVTLPRREKREDGLNAFELLVLRLIALSPVYGLDRIAEECGLDPSLVHGVISRLQSKGFLDSYCRVVRRDEVSFQEEEIHYETIMLFRDDVSGEMLPYVHYLNEKKIEKDLNDGNRSLFVVSAKRVNPTKSDKALSVDEVLATISAYRKVRRHKSFDELRAFDKKQVSIAPRSEHYYLRTSMVFRNGEEDYRIENPVGKGFSLTLENGFRNLLRDDGSVQNWYGGVQNSLLRREEARDDTVEKFATAENQASYPELVACLKRGHGRNYRSMAQIYGSVEWALYYYCRQFDTVKALARLKMMGSAAEMQEFLWNAASNLGFVLEKGRDCFAYIAEDKLRAFENGSAEKDTLVALNLMLAQSDPNADGFLKIARQYPDFFTRLFNIRNARSAILHGDQQAYSDQRLESDSFMEKVVSILLPSLEFESQENQAEGENFWLDMKLRAKRNIHDALGYGLPADLEGMLSYCEYEFCSAKCLPGDRVNGTAFVNSLCSACQRQLSMLISEMELGKVCQEDLRMTVCEKVRSATVEKMMEVPDILLKTSDKRLMKTLQGVNTTLGASVLVFLSAVEAGTLAKILGENPEFLRNFSMLIEKRGHGNRMVMMTHDEMENLRRETYKSIRILSSL